MYYIIYIYFQSVVLLYRNREVIHVKAEGLLPRSLFLFLIYLPLEMHIVRFYPKVWFFFIETSFLSNHGCTSVFIEIVSTSKLASYNNVFMDPIPDYKAKGQNIRVLTFGRFFVVYKSHVNLTIKHYIYINFGINWNRLSVEYENNSKFWKYYTCRSHLDYFAVFRGKNSKNLIFSKYHKPDFIILVFSEEHISVFSENV